jgi:tRNA A-37 threonylcarbamoyl transferase component Bud32
VSAERNPLVEVEAGGVRWQLRSDYAERLLGPEGIRLDEWLRAGQAQVVKHGPHRTVYRVALAGLNVYLKHFKLNDVRARLRQMVRPPKARMEFDRALGIAARQVPTVVPVGVGVRRDGENAGESFLVTHTLDNVCGLDVFIESTLRTFAATRLTAVRFQLAGKLGELIGRLHDAGVLHGDLHAANLLIRLDPGDEIRLFLIDLHAVHLGRPLDWPTSRENLVILNRWFSLRVSRADRLRFWQEYCRFRSAFFAGQHRKDLFVRARELEARTWESNRTFWRHRDRRCLVSNRYYQRVKGPAASGIVMRELDRPTVDAILANPDAAFTERGATILKNSRSSTVVESTMLVNGVARPVIYKRFLVTSWHDPVTALVRRSPAIRSWVFGHGLRERGLPTARPLAVLHRRRNGLCREGYLITEKIENATDLRRWLQQANTLPVNERQTKLRLRIGQVAKLVRDLHERGLSHRDLKAPNLLVAGERIFFIDLVGVSRHRRVPRGIRIQNVSRLNASFHEFGRLTRTDRLRFLRSYLRWGLLGNGGWKRWWREIEQLTKAKIIRNRWRGRPLA